MIHHENNFLIYSLGSAFTLLFLAVFLASDTQLQKYAKVDISLSASVHESISTRLSDAQKLSQQQKRTIHTSVIQGGGVEAFSVVSLEKYNATQDVFQVHTQVTSDEYGRFEFYSLSEGVYRVVVGTFVFDQFELQDHEFLFLDI